MLDLVWFENTSPSSTYQKASRMTTTWMNAQYHQVALPSQPYQAATQHTHNTLRNQQTATANNSYQYGTSNTGIRQLLTAHVATRVTAYSNRNAPYSNRNMPNWQTSAASQRAPSNNRYQRPSNRHLQQNKSAYWNQQVTGHGTQSVRNTVSDGQHYRAQKSFFQNLKGAPAESFPPFVTTATSLPHNQVVCSSTLASATAQNSQTVHDYNHRQNESQHGFSPSLRSPDYNTTMAFGNNSMSTNSSTNQQILYVSSTSQETQQYPTQLTTTQNTGKEATFPINQRNSDQIRFNRYETNVYLSKTNVLPLNHAVSEEELSHLMIARIEDDLRNSFVADSDGCSSAYTSSSYRGKQFVSDVKMTDFNQQMQPLISTVAENQNSNSSRSVPPYSGPSLPKIPNSAMPSRRHSVDVPAQLSSPQDNFYVRAPGDGGGNGSKAAGGVFPNSDSVSTDSAEHQDSQKQFCVDDAGFELAINLRVDQRVSPTTQQPVTSEVPVSQSGDKDTSEDPIDDPKVQELSSIPTTQWTVATLAKLIKDTEEAEMKLERSQPICDSESHFGVAAVKSLASKVREGWYKDLNTDVKAFCCKHVTQDSSVILSQVQHDFVKQLKSYHVLKDNEVHSEPPYKSSWLNVNEQLDDIDKEFGYPWTLKHPLHTRKSDKQPNQVGTVNSIPAQIVSELPNKVLSQTELQPVDSDEEKQACSVEADSTQSPSPNETESDNSIDSCYSFKIQVLSPEEAMVLFEQIQSEKPPSVDMDTQPERVMNSSVEGELPKAVDVTSNDSNPEKESVSQIEEVCCTSRPEEAKVLFEQTQSEKPPSVDMGSQPERVMNSSVEGELPKSIPIPNVTSNDSNPERESVSQIEEVCCSSRLLETIFGPDPLISKCQCKNGESQKDSTDETIDKEEMEIKTLDEMFAISSYGKCHSVMERENQAECGENMDTQVSQTTDFPEDDSKPHSDSDRDPHNISHISINSSSSSIIVISESQDEDLSCSEIEIPQIPGCGQAQLSSIEVKDSSLETQEEQTRISETAAPETTASLCTKHESVERKRKRLSSHDGLVSSSKKPKRCPVDVDSQSVLEGVSKRKVSVDVADSERLTSNVRTVKLVLFGSMQQNKCALNGGRKIHSPFPKAQSEAVRKAPEVLTVVLSPSRRKSSETAHTGEYSAKQKIHEKWWSSFSPIKMRPKSKLKAQKRTFGSLSGMSHKKVERVGPTIAEKLGISSERRTWNGNSGLKRKMSCSERLTHREENTKKCFLVTPKQPADRERSGAENGGHATKPLQENKALRFSVLPKSFHFSEGSSERKEGSDHVRDKPRLVEGKDNGPNKTVTKEKGAWFPNPKKHRPIPPSAVPKRSSLFVTFQKKYMELQPSKHE